MVALRSLGYLICGSAYGQIQHFDRSGSVRSNRSQSRNPKADRNSVHKYSVNMDQFMMSGLTLLLQSLVRWTNWSSHFTFRSRVPIEPNHNSNSSNFDHTNPNLSLAYAKNKVQCENSHFEFQKWFPLHFANH